MIRPRQTVFSQLARLAVHDNRPMLPVFLLVLLLMLCAMSSPLKAATAPTITTISNQLINMGTSTTALAFTVADSVTPASALTLTGTSSNTALVKAAGIVFVGPDANGACSITVTPVSTYSGATTMTVTVTNGAALTAKTTFTLTVNAKPTITTIANQNINENTATAALAITVGDDLTPVTSLALSGASSNLTLVPTTDIVFGGSGASRSVTVTPVSGLSGTATITVTVTDGGALSKAISFVLTVNAPPTITAVANQTINAGTSTSALAFTIGDDLTAVASLTMTGASSNSALVPTAYIVFAGTSAARTVKVTPVSGLTGSSTITLTVTDGGGLIARTSFVLTVYSPPTITTITNQTIPISSATAALAFTVGDAVTPTTALLVTSASSNLTLVPAANVVMTGTGASRAVKVTPVVGLTGSATITLTVKNAGGLQTTMSFIVTVHPAPTISTVANLLINMGTSTSALAFTVSEAGTVATTLVVTGGSSNTALVPAANIVLTAPNSAGACTVTVTPVSTYSGVTTLTLTVTDTGGLTAKSSFILTVNGKPTITTIANQTLNMGTVTSALAFTVGDDLTPVASLTVTASSGNTTLVPNANITFAGSGAARTVTVQPVSGQSGIATITLSVTDSGQLARTTSFTLSVYGPPTITPIANQTLVMGTNTTALPFTVGDSVTAAASLTVTGASSNTTLVPVTGIVFSGSGASRTVTVKPASGQGGIATITLTVKNSDSLSATTSFLVTVHAPPTITAIANQTIDAGSSTAALAFTVGDALTPVVSLTVAATSGNATLAPVANIVFGGSAASRTVKVTPATGQSGTVTITVTVTNSYSLTASTSFLLTVYAVPTISTIANQSINMGTSTAALSFTVADSVTPVASLTLTAASSNTTLVPNAYIVFGGTGASRTVKVTPATAVSGVSTITVTVTNGGSLTAKTTFILTVYAPPTITTIVSQTISIGTTSAVLAFTVGDAVTPVASLVVTGASSNLSLLPTSGIVFGGSGASRTVTVKPVSGQSGMATVTVTVTNGGGLMTTTSFSVTVNAPPTISAIASQAINMGNATSALTFTVGDAITPLSSLTVTAASSNTALVKAAGIIVTGPNVNGGCSLTVTPVSTYSGTTTMTLTVTNGAGLTAKTTFVLTVNGVPTITTIAAQSINMNNFTAPLAFTVGDDLTPVASLTITGASSNTSLVPTANIIFGGSGASRTVTVSPISGQFGTANITLTVADGGGLTKSTTFVLTVLQ